MRVLSLTTLTVLAFGLISAANQILAQQPPSSQFEHIQGLEPFVGIWRTTETQVGEVPMILSCRLTTNRSYLQLDLSTPTDDGPKTMGTLLIGRDFAKEQVSVWGFFGDEQVHGRVRVGEGTASWSETGLRNSGAKSTANTTMKVDGDKLTFDRTDIKYGDAPPHEGHFTFTRSQQRPGRRGSQ